MTEPVTTRRSWHRRIGYPLAYLLIIVVAVGGAYLNDRHTARVADCVTDVLTQRAEATGQRIRASESANRAGVALWRSVDQLLKAQPDQQQIAAEKFSARLDAYLAEQEQRLARKYNDPTKAEIRQCQQ